MTRWSQPFAAWAVAWALCSSLPCAADTTSRASIAGDPCEARWDAAAEQALVWEHPTGFALPQGLAVDARGLLHVAMKSAGVQTFSTRGGPAIGQVPRAKLDNLDAMHLTLVGSRLYVALGSFFSASGEHAGLAILDVSQPRAPLVLGVWRSDEKLKGAATVAIDGAHAYLGAMSAGVMVLDVSNPANIRKLTTFQPDIHFPRRNPSRIGHPNARGLAIAAGKLWVAYDAGGLRVLDISQPARPREVSRYINSKMIGKQQAYNNLVIHAGTAYVGVDYAGLEILDVKNPGAIRQIGWWNPWSAEKPSNLWFNCPGHVNQVEFDARLRRVYLSAGDSELQVVDVANPAQPRLVQRYGSPGNKQGVWGLGIDDDRVYLSYIRAAIPFNANWSGIRAVQR
ncbi:MAG: hypothetical protein KDB14_01755 [Planctomycetales bacterium]|nr:hypothetical protein [Planctomycetales bacterium]